MNPESLLHEAAEMLREETKKGPGTMFLMPRIGGFIVTRAPLPERIKDIIARYDTTEFVEGLTVPQWCSLLKKIWAAHQATQKGDASEQQPAKKPKAS